jgi:hypothetical protein
VHCPERIAHVHDFVILARLQFMSSRIHDHVVVCVVRAWSRQLQTTVQLVSVVDDDKSIQVIGPTADCQQLAGNLDGAMLGTGVIATAPNFYLRIPVGVSYGVLSLPTGGYSQMATWSGSWAMMGKTSSRRRRPFAIPGKFKATWASG